VKRKKMNTKIIVALVVGIALVGLTGAASAGYYYINGDYDTFFEVDLDGYNSMTGDYMYMHNWIYNEMDVDSDSSDASDVFFGFAQGGSSTLTIETELPGNLNTFVSEDVAFQEIEYEVNGDAFWVGMDGYSDTHASTHEGILPIEQMAVWDENVFDGDTWVSEYWNGVEWVPEASIKSGNMGYVCETHGEALMEAEHVLGPVTAGSGITSWSYADGEIWEPYGTIANDIYAYQEVYMWWPTP
jgi:hypothetical protein